MAAIERILKALIYGPGSGVTDPDFARELREGSGISDATIRDARLWTTDLAQDLMHLVGVPTKDGAVGTMDEYVPALAIPYHRPDRPDEIISVRVKTRIPLVRLRNDGQPSDAAKYSSQPRDPPHLYYPPRLLRDEDARMRTDNPLFVPEGEKKALAAESHGLTAVGIAGVESWHLSKSTELLPEFAHLALAGRHVVVAYDSDLRSNHNVQRGLAKFLAALKAAKAIAAPLYLPMIDGKKTGLDDYLVRHGAPALLELAKDAIERARNPIVIVNMAEVVPEPVRWLWGRYVPLGKLTVLDGDPGVGKSTILLWLAARVTRGESIAEHDLGGPRGVILLTAEDGFADTVVPRLTAAGADKSRVHAMDCYRTADDERPLEVPTDVAEIEKLVRKTDARLVIIDPLPAHLGGDVNANKDQDVRRALMPLAKLAERTGAAVIVVRHLNKTPGASAIYRGGGSIGITGAARCVLLLARDPEDPDKRILAVVKASLTKAPRSLRLALPTSEAVPAVATVVIEGEVDVGADELLAERPPGRGGRAESGHASEKPLSKLDHAIMLLSLLLEDGPRHSADIRREMATAGISEATVDRASRQLRINKDGGMWSMPVAKRADYPATSSRHASPTHEGPPPRENGSQDDVISPAARAWNLPIPDLDGGAT